MDMCDRKFMFGDKSTFGSSQNGQNMPKKDQQVKIVIKAKCFQGKMLSRQNVIKASCYKASSNQASLNKANCYQASRITQRNVTEPFYLLKLAAE